MKLPPDVPACQPPNLAAWDAKIVRRDDIGCLRVATVEEAGAMMDELEGVLGVALPREAGPMRGTPPRRGIWLAPRAWLVQCEPDCEMELAEAVAARFPDHRAHASLFSDYLAWLEIAGAGAEAVLRAGSFISLEAAGMPAGHASRTLVAGIPAVICRHDAARWLVGVERSRERYLCDWLMGLTPSKAGY